MREKNAFDLPERCDRDAVEDVVTIIEQRLDDADERGVQLTAAQHLRKFRGRGVNDLFLQASRERHGIERLDRADAKWRE